MKMGEQFQYVSILILVDHTLKVALTVISFLRQRCFNPYSSGSYSKRFSFEASPVCFTQVSILILVDHTLKGLHLEIEMVYSLVSILILVDHTLKEAYGYNTDEDFFRFNPYSSGSYSKRVTQLI